MDTSGDCVTLTLRRSTVDCLTRMPPALVDRMHRLLERNTDGLLTPLEKAEVESLTHIAMFGQLVGLAALRAKGEP